MLIYPNGIKFIPRCSCYLIEFTLHLYTDDEKKKDGREGGNDVNLNATTPVVLNIQRYNAIAKMDESYIDISDVRTKYYNKPNNMYIRCVFVRFYIFLNIKILIKNLLCHMTSEI